MSTDALVLCADRLSAINQRIGHAVSWLTLAMVLVSFAVVVLRYVFALGWVAMQESVVWMHALVFLLGAAATLGNDGHVRVDLFYREASAETKAWVDVLGTIVLLWPVLGLVAWAAEPMILSAWRRLEGSGQAGGLPGLFLLKSMIWAYCATLALQGLAVVLRGTAVLRSQD